MNFAKTKQDVQKNLPITYSSTRAGFNNESRITLHEVKSSFGNVVPLTNDLAKEIQEIGKYGIDVWALIGAGYTSALLQPQSVEERMAHVRQITPTDLSDGTVECYVHDDDVIADLVPRNGVWVVDVIMKDNVWVEQHTKLPAFVFLKPTYEVPLGNKSVLHPNTEFIGANYMATTPNKSNIGNYVYLQSEVRNGRAPRAYDRKALEGWLNAGHETNPYNPQAPLSIKNMRRA
jgi:hypothetical protein